MKNDSGKLREAKAQALGLKIIFLALTLVGALFMGLFSKNKFVRAISAICLVAIGIGVAVYYLDVYPRNVPNTQSDQLGKRMNPVQKFQELLRKAGVPEEAIEASYASGGFEFLHTRSWDVSHTLEDSYFLHDFLRGIRSIDKSLSIIDLPEWKRNELKIRACLDCFSKDSHHWGELQCGYALDARGVTEVKEFVEAGEIALEANEIIRVLASIGVTNSITLNPYVDAASTSLECVERILEENECNGVSEKWIRELANWGIVKEIPVNASENIPVLVSPSFPLKDLVVEGERRDEPFSLNYSSILVLKDGKTHVVYSGRKYWWGELCDEAEALRETPGVKYLTPSGILSNDKAIK